MPLLYTNIVDTYKTKTNMNKTRERTLPQLYADFYLKLSRKD